MAAVAICVHACLVVPACSVPIPFSHTHTSNEPTKQVADQNTDKLHTELKDMHRLFGSVLAFVIAFRTNFAYLSYMEGASFLSPCYCCPRRRAGCGRPPLLDHAHHTLLDHAGMHMHTRVYTHASNRVAHHHPPTPTHTGRRVIGEMMAAIREICLEVYTALPKGHPGPSMDFATDLPGAEPELSPEQRKLLDQVRVCICLVVGD